MRVARESHGRGGEENTLKIHPVRVDCPIVLKEKLSMCKKDDDWIDDGYLS
jgi:hypothetical protein